MTESRPRRVLRGARVSPARNAKIVVAGLSMSAVLGITVGLATAHEAQSGLGTTTTVPAEQGAPLVPSAPSAPVPPAAVVPAPVPAPPTVDAPAPSVPNGTSRGSGG